MTMVDRMYTKSVSWNVIVYALHLLTSVALATSIDRTTNRLATLVTDGNETLLSWVVDTKRRLDTSNNPFKTTVGLENYWQDGEEIQSSLTCLLHHLQEPDDKHKQWLFLKRAITLPEHVSHLFDGLLGERQPDLLASLRDGRQCHARRLETDVEFIGQLITAALRVHQEYRKHVAPSIRTLDLDLIANRTAELSRKLHQMVTECRTDESRVEDEMKTILKAELADRPVFSIERNRIAADRILHFLEDKYDTKMWTVFVVTGESLSKIISGKGYSVRISDGFRLSRVNTTMAGAVSVDRTDVAYLTPLAANYVKHFGFARKSYETLFTSPTYLNDAEYHTNEFLSVMRTKIVTEYVTILYSPSESDDVQHIERVALVSSPGSPNVRLNEHDSEGLLTAVIVPVRPAASLDSNDDCEYVVNLNGSRPLRSQANGMYISVQGNSKEDGALIVLDREWRNETGQRWRLIDNQLRNDHGKCLSAWYRIHARLYQYDCQRNWTEQQWFRHGLQLVNGHDQCLTLDDDNSLRRHYDTIVFYPYHDYCKDDTVAMYWNDWYWNCPAGHSYSRRGATTLVNDYSKRYLTIADVFVRNEGEHREWSNQLGQYWMFGNNGTLMASTGGGECLAPFVKVTSKPPLFPNFYDYDIERRTLNVYLVRHDCQHHQWQLNQQGQLIYTKYGMCLTAMSFSQEVQLVKCDGHADQRWISSTVQ